jgi:NodT family efflux transporter outer membrane factor (OMF) lipoprotein
MNAGRAKQVVSLVALSGAWLVGGCTLGPDWHRPQAALPASFAPPQGEGAASQAEASNADPDWWNIFGDAELTSLENRVATANLDVAAATARLAQSRAARRVAGSARLPSVNGNASYARERASPNGVLGLLGTTEKQSPGTIANGSPGFGPTTLPQGDGAAPFNLWQYGFDASWELDLWGRIRRAIEASDATLDASSYDRRGVLVAALAETARDYLLLRGVQAQIAITRDNIDIATRSLSLARLRLDNGAATNLDVANAGAQLSAVKASLPAQLRDAEQLINALSFLLGAAPRALTAELASATPIPPVPPRVPIGLPSELAAQRPDIREAEARLHQATAQIGVAKADFYPRITLSGSLDIQALQVSNLGSWGSHQFGVGPAISLPIFQGGRLRGTLELREAQQQEAAIVYQRTVLNAWHEVDDALTAYHAAQQQRDQSEETVRQAKIALAAVRTQYEGGSVDFLNVLSVQDRLLTAQRSAAQSTTDTAVALASLYKALGGGWQRNFPLQTDADEPKLAP